MILFDCFKRIKNYDFNQAENFQKKMIDFNKIINRNVRGKEKLLFL